MMSCYDNNFGYCRKQINGTGNSYRIFSVFKLTVGFTDSSAATVATSSPTGYEINVTSTTKFSIGQQISQGSVVDIPANSEIVEITSSTQMRMNNLAAGVHSSISLIVANSDYESMSNVPDVPRTFIKCFTHIGQYINSTNMILELDNIQFDMNSEMSGSNINKNFYLFNYKKIIRFTIKII